ncbi:hypothetical protein BC826DRAFT_1172733 [Russula brevipes]|nr:hypothetical protein BC826DRAFT_1172733 [Russula brevipes]
MDVDPTHSVFYGELLWLFTSFTSGRNVPRRQIQPAPCPNLLFPPSDRDPDFAKRLQTLLDVLASISVWEKKNVAATSVQLTQAGDTLATHLYVVFNSSNEHSRQSCRSHLWDVFESLRGVEHCPSPADGSPKIMDKRFIDDIAKISSSLHTFSWEVFKHRVIKHREKLESITSLVAQYPDNAEKTALSSFFNNLKTILNVMDRLESADTVSPMFTKLLRQMYAVWVRKNLITEHDSGNEHLTVLGRFDLVNANEIGFSVQRWALKIMSYTIATIRLFSLTQSRRLRPILQGEFDITVLESPPPQPPYACDMTKNTIHRALDMALALPPSIRADEKDCDAFVDHTCRNAIEPYQVYRPFPIIHAELAMLAFIKASAIAAAPYIGVSKLSCLMCSSYIDSYSQIVTDAISVRGCHGKVYPSWAWPTMIDTHHDERIRSIFLGKMRQALRQDFERFTEYQMIRRKSDSSVESMSEGQETEMEETMKEVHDFYGL